MGHQIVHVYNLFSGPGMSDQERVARELADYERFRLVVRMSG